MKNDLDDDAIERLLQQQFEGPVADDGFCARVMEQLPARRRQSAWPVCLGLLAGMATCWMLLADSPLLRKGWADWLAGAPSPSAITLWLASGVLALLALAWGLAETRAGT
ncbi:hypothetical protein DBR47_21550 [Paucibacter sp. KBW04]|uniref:hypothetical protein n=1 Tax=Paucibacter sp. KBW04 TaxID=2153361 RepID=UPI000F55D2BE|nr:hypothetical protein [Paucibacter sp. KBW04]RQO54666.1 hypothetical protein DBR47_21550 [Paucibacter sp. KBW04]